LKIQKIGTKNRRGPPHNFIGEGNEAQNKKTGLQFDLQKTFWNCNPWRWGKGSWGMGGIKEGAVGETDKSR